MKIRKLFTAFILGAVLFSVLITGNTYAVSTPAVSTPTVASFSDVVGYQPAYKAINYLRKSGIVVGYADGTFGVDRNINRAEFLKIVMEASEYQPGGNNCYKDVKEDWYAPYVCKAAALGFVNGYPDGYFRPEREINFAEASKIVANILGLEKANVTKNWFSPFVYALEEKDAIPANILNFDQKLTRSDMAEMTWRLMTDTTYKVSNTYENIQAGEAVLEHGNGLMNFESCGEIAKYFENNTEEQGYAILEEDMMMPMAMSKGETSSELGGGGGEGAPEYSSTNVQVEGVDEADIIKNDSKYIYSLKRNSLRIVEAYPPNQMQELNQVTFGDNNFFPMEMYVDGERLVVIGNSYNESYFEEDGGVIKPLVDFDYSNLAKVYIFDISDRKNVKLLRQLSFEGNYSSSRKIDNVVYLVADQYTYFSPLDENEEANEADLVPVYSDSVIEKVEPLTACNQVMYMPEVIDSTNYIIVAGIPIDDSDADISEKVVLGSSGTIYASRDNLYIAESKYSSFDWYGKSGDKEETYIHKFALNGVETVYKGVSAVPGTILNQFSMDEYDGNFRIATTLGDIWTADPPAVNNLYIIDSDLNITGRLEGLAPGEKIYAVRFAGERAYIVTFKKVDPLFVIDVSDSANPNVLGKLKIPGYSDYLHPYDENHLIGFGKEAVEASEEEIGERGLDFAWYQGLKIAMFDVTDVNNPIELYKTVIGDRGTDSPLLSNHKALLFDKAKGFMAFPVTLAELPADVKNNPSAPPNTYADFVYQGAYIFDVSIENGFTLRGRLTHYTENEISDKSGDYWYGDKDIDRILYLGNYFYTVSQEVVMANEMADLNEVKKVELKSGE